jgi:legumain
MFPDTVVFADELNDTLRFMHSNKMYSELLLFIEACESGSLFQDIDLESINALALTATNSTSPSYGTYCFPHDKVNGQNLYSCLGDMFSVAWMEYLEKNPKLLGSVTIKQLYQLLKQQTTKSEV